MLGLSALGLGLVLDCSADMFGCGSQRRANPISKKTPQLTLRVQAPEALVYHGIIRYHNLDGIGDLKP